MTLYTLPSLFYAHFPAQSHFSPASDGVHFITPALICPVPVGPRTETDNSGPEFRHSHFFIWNLHRTFLPSFSLMSLKLRRHPKRQLKCLFMSNRSRKGDGMGTDKVSRVSTPVIGARRRYSFSRLGRVLMRLPPSPPATPCTTTASVLLSKALLLCFLFTTGPRFLLPATTTSSSCSNPRPRTDFLTHKGPKHYV